MTGQIFKTAVISADGRYRYMLSRIWDTAIHTLIFVMLNPSTADAEVDDPTIRRCMGFARRDGYSGITVLNLYALRATDPRELWKADDPVGPENDAYLREMLLARASMQAPVVAAWGSNAKVSRVAEVLKLAGSDALHVLGRTKDGAPRHPLYLRGDAPLERWLVPGAVTPV